MDLMIDCMPLYEMLEDDMRTIANLHCSSSSTSSPSCLSDEEQLALSSCTNMLDDFLFFSTPNNNNTNLPNTPQVAVAPAQNQQNNLTYSNLSTVNTSQFNDPDQSRFNNSYNGLNSSFYSSSSSSSCSSSGTSSPLSSASLSSAAASPLSLSMSSSSLCAALANTSFTPIQTPSSSSSCSSSLSSPVNPNSTNNQFNNNSFSYQVSPSSDYSAQYSQPQPQQQQHQPLNQTSSTSKYMQDSYLNNNYNLYQVINPMDINRTYTITSSSSHQQSQQVYENYDNAKSKTLLGASSSSLKLPTTVLATRPGDNSIQQQAKRGKYAHASQPSSASSINNTINSILNETMKLKQESLNSDGESSIVSNESDSNSNSSSEDNNQNGSSMQASLSAATPKLSHININNINSKKLIITTKLEPFYSSSSSSSTQSLSSNVNTNANQINLIKITNSDDGKANAKKTDNLNHKTIIQYKQLINGSAAATASSTASLVKSSAQLSAANKTNKNASNATSTDTQQQTNHNGVPLATRPDGKVYPKPPYSYSCLIAMALRNSDSGTLPVSDIYDFIM